MGEESGMEKPHRYPVIFNPRARSQKGGRVMRFIESHPDRLTLHPTNYAGEARELASRFAAEGEPVVIAAGGDGTLNEVVNGLAGSKTMLGVLPAGTMNVFAREMGIPCDSLDQALLVIERGFVQEVDLFGANGSPFVQMAGVGFDALVIEETSWETKKLLGPLAYLLAAVQGAWRGASEAGGGLPGRAARRGGGSAGGKRLALWRPLQVLPQCEQP